MAQESPRGSDPKARRLVVILSILSALFCWGVAAVVGGTTGLLLAVSGVLALGSGVLNLTRSK